MLVALIPAYNEEKTLQAVIDDTRPFVDEIVVINDGSSDRTAEIARSARVKLVEHVLNRGLGASLRTGMALALELGADFVVTMDADGQLRGADIPVMVAPLKAGEADVVLGSRFLGAATGMPLIRIVYNRIASLVTGVLFGAWISDSQAGMRAFSRSALATLLPRLVTNRMEISSEIVKEVMAVQLRLKEIPIVVRYTEYSMSKGQSLITGIRTFWKLLLRRVMK